MVAETAVEGGVRGCCKRDPGRSAALVERHRREAEHSRVRAIGGRAEWSRLRPAGRPDCRLRQRRDALVGAALYIQLAFALDRVKALAPEHPEWRTTQPFQAVLENDTKALGAAGVKGLLELVVATHAGMTTDEFERIGKEWFASAKHPRFNRPYTDMAFRPMVELLGHLRANGFKTYIVSGGGIEFMRVIAEQLYGIPPAQVIGSSGKLQLRDTERRTGHRPSAGARLLRRQRGQAGRHPEVHRSAANRRLRQLRRRPADAAMDRRGFRASPDGVRRPHRRHSASTTTASRRWDASTSDSPKPPQRGWTVVSMKDDWKRIFAFE